MMNPSNNVNPNNDPRDAEVQQIVHALGKYKKSHSSSRIDVQRQNNVSIRIRIIDSGFKGMDRVDREPEIWELLETLPENVYTCITMLLLLTPEEAKRSFANMEFEDPVHVEL